MRTARGHQEGVLSPHGLADEQHRRQAQLLDHGDHIPHVHLARMLAQALLAAPVAALIQREDMPMLAQPPRGALPFAAAPGQAVQREDRRAGAAEVETTEADLLAREQETVSPSALKVPRS